MTGPSERAIYNKMNENKIEYKHLIFHIERYVYAMRFVRGLTVIDAACGTCYGSWLLSLGARHVVLADYDQKALDYAGQFNFCCQTTVLKIDLDKQLLPPADAVVSLKTIEHLENPEEFLKNIKTKLLIWSLPVNVNSKFHKSSFKDMTEIRTLFKSSGWKITGTAIEQVLYEEQKFYYGIATR